MYIVYWIFISMDINGKGVFQEWITRKYRLSFLPEILFCPILLDKDFLFFLFLPSLFKKIK